MTRTISITPYKNKSELLRVRELFYEDFNDSVSLKAAIDTVLYWQSRGKVPHAVNTTAWLVSAVLNDAILTERSKELRIRTERGMSDALPRNAEEYVLRNAYSMALVRFVNGILDPYQQGTYAVALLTLAKEIELPYFFVEVRHWATHEQLPSLEILRATSHRALEWLHIKFWSLLDASQNLKRTKFMEKEMHFIDIKLDVTAAFRAYRSCVKSKFTTESSRNNSSQDITVLEAQIHSIATSLSLDFHLARLLALKKALLKEASFSTIHETYGDLVAKLPPKFLLLLVHTLLLETHSNCSVHSIGSMVYLNTKEWFDLFLSLILGGPYPFRLHYHVYNNDEDVLQSLENYHRVLHYHNHIPCDFKTIKLTKKPDLKFAKAPLLEELLQVSSAPPGKQMKRNRNEDPEIQRVTNRSKAGRVFEKPSTWRILPFGISAMSNI
ncbi:Las1-domain-containing protein [Metschnikowia bicuspidata var. bicuspidata NRRL YB-4993]|uniref:Las1-domain-containing protein n=1 Tax=Metschnikowia bicuspidata var. bicuspidata NRRL YB-4993 TaxID=869754 RepID=A0A1A0HG97_9ASCO|nr:Las1-domain-containing protein [Metschnikowia bicuspidata var. bicuspidata NRRL YB-4993]OBA22883.1 Las1-domain-containing protein [Metschnikowia bicuspidata var. bicuspidata NRRL YB-4993]